MVRTLASTVRVRGGKSTKAIKNAVPSTSGLQSSRSSGSIGGNPAAHRETPPWQRPITNFFKKSERKSTSITTLLTNNESFDAIEKGNLPSTLNKDTDEGEQCRPQTSNYGKNESENEDKSRESENKENENNSNTDDDFQKRGTPTDENDADLLPAKRRKIDYQNLEAIEKFAR